MENELFIQNKQNKKFIGRKNFWLNLKHPTSQEGSDPISPQSYHLTFEYFPVMNNYKTNKFLTT